jgi:hypothetical protein
MIKAEELAQALKAVITVINDESEVKPGVVHMDTAIIAASNLVLAAAIREAGGNINAGFRRAAELAR